MGFPTRKSLEGLLASGQDLDALAGLDAAGHLIAPGESFEAYVERLCDTSDRLYELEGLIKSSGGQELCPGVLVENKDRIPAETLAEAEAETERLYGFKIDWVPGFFLSKGVGALWGGCAISFPGNGPSVFLIRSSFRSKERWFIYDRDELMAHELCHVARTPLADRPLEEHFAYQTSKSALRRCTGNCFQTQWDAILFILPVFVLLGAQICRSFAGWNVPAWPFWLFAGAVPFLLLVRNQIARATLAKAERALKGIGCAKPAPLLFRCSMEETKEIAGASVERLREIIEEKVRDPKSPRWAVIAKRFMGEEWRKGRNGNG